MLRDFLRIIGSACIIAGALFFFMDNSSEDANAISTASKLETELKTLQDKLIKTENELANLQTAGIAASESANEVNPETDEEDGEGTKDKQVIKMVLLIEPGMDSTTIGELLERSEIIQDRAAFETYLDDNNLSGKIQIGKYDVDSSMEIKHIVAMMTK